MSKEQTRARVMDFYGEKQDVIGWKKASDRFSDRQTIRAIYHNMRYASLVPMSGCVFFSPTVNVPTHELELFRTHCENGGENSLFIAGDLVVRPEREEHKNVVIGSSTFAYIRADADYLPIKDESVDVFWDRKGWIWHLADHEDRYEVLEALQKYRQKIKVGGSLILDAAEGTPYNSLNKFWLRHVVKRLYAMRGDRIPMPIALPFTREQYENSTVDEITTLDSSIWEEIASDWKLFVMGEKRQRVAVLKRK